MSEPLSDSQRQWLTAQASNPRFWPSQKLAFRAAIARLDHLEAVNAELYAACESMLRHIDQVGDDEDLKVCRNRIKAALAKTRGESDV